MIQKLVSLALRMSVVVAIAALGIVGLGLYAYSRLDIEAYPNPVPPMIEVITQPTGWSAQEVERYVTVPVETGLSGMIDLDHIRSQSLFGLSDVKCYFDWNIKYREAKQEVLNRLGFVDLPPGLSPQISPWNAIGEVFRYQLVGKGYTLAQLKSAEDWILERQWRQVPGVIDVTSFGGETKQYHVQLDPFRLLGQNVTLPQVTSAIANANANVGGGYMNLGEQAFTVRGTGLIRSLEDIGNIVVTEKNGVPIRVKDLADVLVGHAPHLGVVGRDLQPDIVEGIVLMRYNGNSLETIQGVHKRLAYIRKFHLLPPGMKIVPYYDRLSLVHVTTHTVLENLILGMLLVSLILWAFLGSLRAALVCAVNIPLALLLAFMGMVATATPANLISLGAVDFGIVIDSTVIVVENIFRHLSGPSTALGMSGGGARNLRIVLAAGEVATPVLYSTLIIAVAFIPLFAMNGVSGVIFSPMAHTYAFAIGGALLLAVTLTPVLAKKFVGRGLVPRRGQGNAETPQQGGDAHRESFLVRQLQRLYAPLFGFALAWKKLALAIAIAPVVLAILVALHLGGEFMPHLEEGNFWIRATLPVSVSLEQSSKYVGQMRRILLGCPLQGPCDLAHRGNPEITTVVSQLGRPDDGTDTVGYYNIELFAPLAPRSRWPAGVTKASLTEKLSKELTSTFPGIDFNFSQYISDNVEEAMSGIKGENAVKVVGPNLVVDEKKADEIAAVMAKIRGVTDLGVFRTLGQPSVRIRPDREACGRYGLNVGDVEAVVQAAIGGQAVTQVYEGEQHYDLTVRWAPKYRKDLASLREIPVPTPDGASVPLGEVASIVEQEGPSLIYREDLNRYVPVKFSVRGRDLTSTIAEAKRAIRAQVKLPYDTHLEWAGEANELADTLGRLGFLVPMTLLLIALLVFLGVGTWRDTLIVLAGIPVACSGGIFALFLTRTNFSISAAMGFVSIFGVAVQDALLVVTYVQRLWKDGASIQEGARLAAERGLRPVLMTICVATLGLTPAALSHGIGSETQKPLAIVVIGGALMLAVLPRLLQPALLVLAHKKDGANRTNGASDEPVLEAS